MTAVADPAATTADDTRRAAAAILRRRPDLLVFAGGDGTARDIVDVVGDALPLLGIPAGVKMHSAVFARSADDAGEAAARFLAAVSGARDRTVSDAHDPSARGGRHPGTHDAEIMDIDEDAVRAGRLSARLYGYARVPALKSFVQSAKSGPPLHDDAALAAACVEIARGVDPGRLTLFGPGTTTRRVLQAMGLDGTLLGVDAVIGGRVIGADLTERQILALLDRHPGEATIVVGVVGGQGALFGRGNQQLGPAVLARVGRDGIVVVASLEKLAALGGAGLFVDTGDPAVDRMLAGHIRVHTGPGMTSIARIDAAAAVGAAGPQAAAGAASPNKTAA